MIKTLSDNIFESKCQTIVNTVNCVGVMGKGLALEFKNRFPDMYKDYVALCRANKVKLGEPYLFKHSNSLWILNFPTKDHWRSISKLHDIIRGLMYLQEKYKDWGITSIAFPALGCSNGQLEWRDVQPRLHRILSRFDIPVEIYAPAEAFQQELSVANKNLLPEENYKNSKTTPATIALVEILARIVREPFHWPVGRISFQKMAYFATALGLPTGFTHVKGSYGPFSAEVKPAVTKLVNTGLIEEKRLGRMFSIKPSKAYSDEFKIYKDDIMQWESIICKVSDLFLRINTKQAEIAATVHFVAAEVKNRMKNKPSEEDIFKGVKDWKQERNPPLEDEDIAKSIRSLNILGWIDASLSTALPLPKEFLDI